MRLGHSALLRGVWGLPALLPQLTFGQPCSPYWVKPDPFTSVKYGGPSAVFDDGSGPALFTQSALPFTPAGPWATISRWDGRRWTKLHDGLPALLGIDQVLVLDTGSGPRLYVGGSYVFESNVRYQLWVWDGAGWQPTPDGFGQAGTAIAPSIPYCSFDDGAGMAVYGRDSVSVAKWTGSRWVELGFMHNYQGCLMDVFDLGEGPALYVAGQFSGIASVPGTRGIAKWQHGNWHSLDGGFVGTTITGMAVLDSGAGPELYVAGDISLAGGVPISTGIAKWDGQRWAGLPTGPNGYVRGIAAFDDGAGPALHATGDFSSAGGVPANHIAKFDGVRWWPLGAGTPYVTSSMTVFDDGRGASLFVVAGGGAAGGGYSSPGLVQWVGCPSCQADCDNDGRLNVSDFICFMNRYAVRDPYTNCNVDQAINISDFVCFQNRFAQGCP